jgi:hypothetical protein
MDEELTYYDPRNKRVYSDRLIKLWFYKMVNLGAEAHVSVSTEELELRRDFDRFVSKLVTTNPVSNQEIIQRLQNDDEQFWDNLFYLELLIKSGREFSKEEQDECYKIKFRAVNKLASFEDVKEMKVFSDSETVKEYAIKLMTIMRASVEKNSAITDFIVSNYEYRYFEDLINYYVWIFNSLSVVDLFSMWLEDETVLQYVDNSTAERIADEAAKYFEDYSDDNLSMIATRYLVNVLPNKCKSMTMDELVKFVQEKISEFGNYGVKITDLDFVNFALGQCKEMMNYD